MVLCIASTAACALIPDQPVQASGDVAQAQQPKAASDVESRPIGPERRSADSESSQPPTAVPASSLGLSRTFASLVVVVGIAYVGALAWKRFASRRSGLMAALGAGGKAPSGVLEVLARYPVARAQRLVLIRVGRRVVLVCQSSGIKSSSGGMSVITEFTDADEVASLLRSVRHADGTDSVASFKGAIKELDHAPLPDLQAEMRYVSAQGDTVEWRDERIQMPAPRATTSESPDPAVGRLRSRLAAMREKGTCA
jgi:flagellar biogenesis protein FliO